MCHTKDFLRAYNQNGATVSFAANVKWAICLYLLPSWLISTQQKQKSHWLVLLITLPVRQNQKTNLNLFTVVSPSSYYVHSHDSLCLETTTKITFPPWYWLFKQFSHVTLTLSEEQRKLEKRRSLESTVPRGPVRQGTEETAVSRVTPCMAWQLSPKIVPWTFYDVLNTLELAPFVTDVWGITVFVLDGTCLKRPSYTTFGAAAISGRDCFY